MSSLNDYVVTNPVLSCIDGSTFRTSINELSSYIKSVSENKIQSALVGINLARGNIEIDFTDSINKASDSINRGLMSVVITDPDYTTKKEVFDTDIATISDDAVAAATAGMSGLSDHISTYRVNVSNDIDSLVDSHTYARPLLRYTGRISLPSPLALDDFNTFSFEFTNIGRITWSGWLGITLRDEYYKRVSLQDSDHVYDIAPGETSKIDVSVKVPKIVYVKGLPRNLGKQITYTIHVNTRKWM